MKKKVVVRAKDGDVYRLIHVAYVPEEVYTPFLELTHDRERSIAEYIESWAKQDGLGTFTVTNAYSLKCLKFAIKEKALISIATTELFSDECNITGSINAWVTEHMKKELNNGYINS